MNTIAIEHEIGTEAKVSMPSKAPHEARHVDRAE
jgi:hypothetical protein